MWLRNHGLMWLYRLLQEPRRLGRRYLIANFQFVAIVFRELLRQRAPQPLAEIAEPAPGDADGSTAGELHV